MEWSACAAPAGRGPQPDSRAASGPDLGVLRPLCEELADGPDTFTGTRKRGPELRQNRKGLPRAAAERREARGWAFPAVISGGPEMGPTARRATGAAYPHQRLSALCSPLSFIKAELGMVRRAKRRGEGERMPAAPPLTCDPRAQTLSRHKAGTTFVLPKKAIRMRMASAKVETREGDHAAGNPRGSK